VHAGPVSGDPEQYSNLRPLARAVRSERTPFSIRDLAWLAVGRAVASETGCLTTPSSRSALLVAGRAVSRVLRSRRFGVRSVLTSGVFSARLIRFMSAVAFDTLKLAQRLEAAGLPPKQAQDVASALSEAIGEAVVTREYLDLRLNEMRNELDLRLGEIRAAMATKVELAEAKGEILKWMFGAVGLQTLAILGGVPALIRLLG
jgi:hypothetical protein